MTGRYRNSQPGRASVKAVLIPLCALLVAAAAAYHVAGISLGSSAGPRPATLDGAELPPWGGAEKDDRGTGYSRGRGGDRRLAPEPTAPVTVSGPVVNGREQPFPVDPPQSGKGTYQVASGGAGTPDGSGNTVEYIVEVEEGLPFDADEFAADVHAILTDERGWGHKGDLRFERVDDGPVPIRVSLSSADLTDEKCHPLLTRGRVSCWNGTRAVINAERWGMGVDTYDDDILSYREYLINHEVGHGLGHGHENCPADGAPSPVMVQQTKSLEGCEPNPWPAEE